MQQHLSVLSFTTRQKKRISEEHQYSWQLLGRIDEKLMSHKYWVPLINQYGKTVFIEAHGIDRITSDIVASVRKLQMWKVSNWEQWPHPKGRKRTKTNWAEASIQRRRQIMDCRIPMDNKREELPDNKKAAMGMLMSMQKRLAKNPKHANQNCIGGYDTQRSRKKAKISRLRPTTGLFAIQYISWSPDSCRSSPCIFQADLSLSIRSFRIIGTTWRRLFKIINLICQIWSVKRT